MAQVETVTSVPSEVPLWLCPQLNFYAYPGAMSCAELNNRVRAGHTVEGRRRIEIKRPERPGEGVRYAGVSAPGEERLSQLFGGALGAAVDDGSAAAAAAGTAGRQQGDAPPDTPATAALGRATPVMTVAPAWGSLAGDGNRVQGASGSLIPPDGVGEGLDDLEEEWLHA